MGLHDHAVLASVCPAPSPAGFPQSFAGVGEITGGSGEFSDIAGSVLVQETIAQRDPVAHMGGTVSQRSMSDGGVTL